jgi:type III secretory pathway component EscU
MSYQLRAIGFSRLVCQFSDAQLDYIRTLILLTNQSQSVTVKTPTFLADSGVYNYLELGNGMYLEGSCDPEADEILKLNAQQLVEVVWEFNLTRNIPF